MPFLDNFLKLVFGNTLQQDKDPLCKCLEPKWLLPVLGNILPVDSKIEVCLLSCCK